MNEHRTLQHKRHRIALLLGILICFVSACAKLKLGGTSEVRYKADTVILIRLGDNSYLARVMKDTKTDAEEAPIHIFSEKIRKQVGDTIPIKDVVTTREEPLDGWGTRKVALEYSFDGITWKYETDVIEVENYYLLPERVTGNRRVEFSQVRFISMNMHIPVE